MLTRTHEGTFEDLDQEMLNIPKCLKTALKATGSRHKPYRGGFITWCLSLYAFGTPKKTLKASRNVLALVDLYLRPLQVFNLLLLGNRGVGKTTFAKKWKSRSRSFYFPTFSGVNGVNQIPLQTNHRKVLFNAWDIPYWSANEMLGKDGDPLNHYSGVKSLFALADCAIIMYDVTSRMSYKCLTEWYRELTQVAGSMPIVVVGNKIDKNRDWHVIKPRKMLSFYKRTLLYDPPRGAPPTQFFEMSAKANINCDGPLLYLARLLTHEHLDENHGKGKYPGLQLVGQTPIPADCGSNLPVGASSPRRAEYESFLQECADAASHAATWISDDDDL